MSIIRAPRPRQQYLTVTNDLVRGRGGAAPISLRAIGLLVQLLSHEPGWRTDSVTLAKANVEGRDAVRTALKELEEARYLVRHKWQSRDGKWSTDSFVFDEPVPEGFNPATLLDVPEDPPELSTGPEAEDEHLFEASAFAQVTPETDSQAPVEPTTGKPTPDSQALTRRTIEEHAVVHEGGETSGGRAPAPPPPEEPPARSLAALGRDEHGPLSPFCRAHPQGTQQPCGACAVQRDAYGVAEQRRSAVRRRQEADRVIQEARRAKAHRTPSDAPTAQEALAAARAAAKAAREQVDA